MDSVEDYASQWAKREKEDLDTLSEWVKSVRSLIQIRIKKLSGSMSTRSKSICMTKMLLNTCLSFMTNANRGVFDNFKVTLYNVASRIIYEWETCIKTMFGSSLPPVICRRVHVLFTLSTNNSCIITTKVRENRRGNQKWTIQRNWQHRVHNTYKHPT
jgi:hypothetical protein